MNEGVGQKTVEFTAVIIIIIIMIIIISIYKRITYYKHDCQSTIRFSDEIQKV